MADLPTSLSAIGFDSKAKPLVNRKPEDLKSLNLRNEIDVDKCAIRVRAFQPEDAEQVKELFWVGLTVGPLSSLEAALRGSPKRINSIILYMFFLLGLYFTVGSLSWSIFRYVTILDLQLESFSKGVTEGALCRQLLGILLSAGDLGDPDKNPDLMNIGKHYCSIATIPDEKEGMKEEGPDVGTKYGPRRKIQSGFWVAELLAPNNGNPTGYIVGCVGLVDSSPSTGDSALQPFQSQFFFQSSETMSSPPASSPVAARLNPKSLADREPEELEAFQLPKKIDVNKCAIRIRPLQPEDASQVQELFWIGIAVGPMSARTAALRGSLTRPNSILLYSLFLFGLYLAITSRPPPPPRYAAFLNLPVKPVPEDVIRSLFYKRLLGIALSIASVALFVFHRYHLGKIFRHHSNPDRSPDLANVWGHYAGSTTPKPPSEVTAEKGDPQTKDKRDPKEPVTNACGFWVAELLHPDDGRPTGYVVGCVGIVPTRRVGTADVVGFGMDGVSVLRNSIRPTIQQPTGSFGYNAGWRNEDHVRLVGDTTGNGRSDIIAFGEHGVTISYNNGSGSFSSPSLVLGGNFGSGAEAGSWRVDKHIRYAADLLKRGYVDIIGFADDGVFVSLNNGDGTFAPPQLALAQFGFAAGGYRREKHLRFLADVTGDGCPDIVGFGETSVQVSLNNGDGTFQKARPVVPSFAYSGGGWRVERHPRILADLTGDGRADIVGFADAGVYVALNNGNGTFQEPKHVLSTFGAVAGGWQVSAHPRYVVDVTGNGCGDIVGFANAGVYVALGNGDGTFQPSKLVVAAFGYEAGGWRVGITPRYVVDMTGDGAADIVGISVDGAVQVSYNDGKGNFGAPQGLLSRFGSSGWDVDKTIRMMANL
ncbi:hypothetical protein MD484_g8094, partial [Candolleomyces efflorescens]